MSAVREIDRNGWILIAASTVGVSVCIIPVAILSFGVFMKPLGDAFGFGRGDLSLMLTLLSLAMAAALPLSGRLIDAFGIKMPLGISFMLFAASIGAIPFTLDTFGLPGLYALSVIIGVVGAPSSTVAYVKVLSGWFDKTRGLAMGFAMSGIALGGAITPIYASTLIEAFGWRGGFYGLALLPLVIGLVVTAILHEAPHVAARGDRTAVPGLTQAQALKTRVFWMLMLLFLVAATAIHGVQIHLAPLLSDLGLTPENAALGVSFMFGISVVMRLVAGYLFDRVFAPYIGALCFLSAAIGSGMLISSAGPAGLLFAVALLGVGAGAESDLMGYLVSRYFGLKAYGAIFGWTSGALMVGSALGPALLGFSHDATGSYAASLIWCTAGLVLTAFLLAILPRYPDFKSPATHATRTPAAVPAE